MTTILFAGLKNEEAPAPLPIRCTTDHETSRTASKQPPESTRELHSVNNALLESIKIDLAIMKSSNERLTSLVEMVLTKLQVKETAVGHDLLPKLPIETREVFEGFNVSLATKDVRAQMVSAL